MDYLYTFAKTVSKLVGCKNTSTVLTLTLLHDVLFKSIISYIKGKGLHKRSLGNCLVTTILLLC